jgi:RNA polymerase sigma-70 factor (ECF subfamily)
MESGPHYPSLDPQAYWMTRSRSGDEAPPDTEPLAATVRLAVGGDRAAFERIVIEHERRVLSVAWRLLGSLDDAEDAAQEVFLRAYRYLHRFDASRQLTPWLMRITVNVCRDLQRRSKDRRVEEQGSVDTVVEPADGPFDVLAGQERRRLLWNALDTLPEKERAAIVLRDLEGMSTPEVAEALDSSPATVRSQISSARLKIRKAFDRARERRS